MILDHFGSVFEAFKLYFAELFLQIGAFDRDLQSFESSFY